MATERARVRCPYDREQPVSSGSPTPYHRQAAPFKLLPSTAELAALLPSAPGSDPRTAAPATTTAATSPADLSFPTVPHGGTAPSVYRGAWSPSVDKPAPVPWGAPSSTAPSSTATDDTSLLRLRAELQGTTTTSTQQPPVDAIASVPVPWGSHLASSHGFELDESDESEHAWSSSGSSLSLPHAAAAATATTTTGGSDADLMFPSVPGAAAPGMGGRAVSSPAMFQHQLQQAQQSRGSSSDALMMAMPAVPSATSSSDAEMFPSVPTSMPSFDYHGDSDSELESDSDSDTELELAAELGDLNQLPDAPQTRPWVKKATPMAAELPMPEEVNKYNLEIDDHDMGEGERKSRVAVALARDYALIRKDPRYRELLHKYDPSSFTRTGLKQKGKDLVDPGTIPYLGAAVATYRAAKNINKVSKISNLRKAGGASEEINSSLVKMDRSIKAHAVESTVYATIDVALTCLPLVDFFTLIPGVQQQLLLFGKLGAQTVAQAGTSAFGSAANAAVSASSQTAVLLGTSAASGNVTRNDLTENFGSSKAFICYLGLPMDNDIHYEKYEPARLRLKALYGCRPEEDLFKMKPRGPLKKHLEQCERNKHYEPDIPVLLILFRIFDCWDEPYWDMIARTKKRLRSTRELADLTHTAIDPRIRMLNHHKQYLPDVVEVLVTSFLRTNRVRYLFKRHEPRSSQRDRLEWFMEMTVKYLWKRAHVWGFIEDNRLLAVAIWGDPNYCKHTSVSDMLPSDPSTPIALLGAEKYSRMKRVLKIEQRIQRAQKPKGWWTLHWVGVVPYAQRNGIGTMMVQNILCKLKSSGAYTQVANCEIDGVRDFLLKQGFVEKSADTVPQNKKSTRPPVVIHSLLWTPPNLAKAEEEGRISGTVTKKSKKSRAKASSSSSPSSSSSLSSPSLTSQTPEQEPPSSAAPPLTDPNALYAGNLL